MTISQTDMQGHAFHTRLMPCVENVLYSEACQFERGVKPAQGGRMGLFSRKSSAAVISTGVQTMVYSDYVAPVPQIATPTGRKLSTTDVPDEEYLAIAKDLGLSNGLMLEATIARLGLSIYNRDEVGKYLDAKFKSRDARHGWVWVPLREQDKAGGRGYAFNDTDRRIYNKAIPFPVLQTIKNIQAEHPTACFYVSDERERSDEKDPFLLVTFPGNAERWIVERWDEPSFRG